MVGAFIPILLYLLGFSIDTGPVGDLLLPGAVAVAVALAFGLHVLYADRVGEAELALKSNFVPCVVEEVITIRSKGSS